MMSAEKYICLRTVMETPRPNLEAYTVVFGAQPQKETNLFQIV